MNTAALARERRYFHVEPGSACSLAAGRGGLGLFVPFKSCARTRGAPVVQCNLFFLAISDFGNKTRELEAPEKNF